MRKYEVGDSFWLIPGPYNPFAVKVAVVALSLSGGYFVDEPVGDVINDLCIFQDEAAAKNRLLEMHRSGVAVLRDDLPKGLDEFRDSMLGFIAKLGKPLPHPHPPKQHGKDWFSLQDVLESST